MADINVNTIRFGSAGAHTSNGSISAATALTIAAGAKMVLVQAITQNIRMTLDGTAPTATVGFQIRAGDPPICVPVEGNTIKVIEETATATVQYQCGA